MAALCSQYIACSPARSRGGGRPLNSIVSCHPKMRRGSATDAFDTSNYTEWFVLNLIAAGAAFPVLWAFAWSRFSSADMASAQRLRLSAGTAAKALLPLLFLTAGLGLVLVMAGTIAFFWIYGYFFAPPGGINVDQNRWLLDAPFFAIYPLWYLLSVAFVVRWLPKSPDESYIM